MTSYFNELAPWEEKKQYHEILKLGTTVDKQLVAIKKASESQIGTLLSSTSSIISSQERTAEIIRSGFSDLTYSLDDISKGINNLGAIFEWGISEVIWQIEQNTEVLKDILRTLQSPKGTEAEERKRWGDRAYADGLLDDALEDYLASEKIYKYDFSIYLSIGMIYLKYIIDKTKALEYFDKAIKYARPKSNYHTSFALLCKGVTLFDINKTEEAEESSQEAINISPNLLETYYQNAQYNAQLGNVEKSMSNLYFTFTNDVKYILKFENDKLFDPIRLEMNDKLIKLKDEIYESSKNSYKILLLEIERLHEITLLHNKVCKFKFQELSYQNEKNRFLQLLGRNSILDAVETKVTLFDFKSLIKKEKDRFLKEVLASIRNYELQIKHEETIIKESVKTSGIKDYNASKWIFVISVIVGFLYGFKGCSDQFESHNPDGALWYFIRNMGIVMIIGFVIFFIYASFNGTKGEKSQLEDSKEIQTIKSVISYLNRISNLIFSSSIEEITTLKDIVLSLPNNESIYLCYKCGGEMELTEEEINNKHFICADCGESNKINNL